MINMPFPFILWTVVLIVLLGLHVALQMRFFRSWPDWDTSCHLYFAFLKHRGVCFSASYRSGIKWAVPRLNALLWPLFDGKIWRFRLVNIVAGAVVLLCLLTAVQEMTIGTFALLVLSVLLVNSAYVGAPTSAAEFISVPIAMVTILIGPMVPEPWSLYLQVLLVTLLGLGFKAVDLVYVVPVMGQHYEYAMNQPILGLSASLPVLAAGLYLVFSGFGSFKEYALSRGFLHPKSIRFLLVNPLFCLGVAWLTYQNCLNGGPDAWLTLGACWGALLVQRMMLLYFWYPLVIFNLYYLLVLGWYTIYPPWMICAVPALFFLGHSFWMIRYTPQEYVDDFVRKFTMFFRGRALQIATDKKQTEWLQKNIPKDERVYLWGSKTVLLLEACLKHVGETFYNHNHLFYWSSIKDKEAYARDTVEKQEPTYVIEAGVINGVGFPEQYFRDKYSRIGDIDDMRVFRFHKSEQE